MNNVNQAIEHHYGHAGILDAVVNALKQQGIDTTRLQPDDLAPMDEFHVRGREGTAELAGRVRWRPGMKLLDVGCGIGGSSRYLAHTHECEVTGIDLTHEFIDTAKSLSDLVGLDHAIRYLQGSATELPFEDNSFDIAWTQHVQMNIEDKRKFYAEMARVLKPGGQLVFHDVFQNGDAQPHFPVPWASDQSISFLTTPETARSIIESLGLKIMQWEDTTDRSLAWMQLMSEKARQAAKPMPGINVIMGESAKIRLENAMRSLVEDRLRVVQAVAIK